VFKNIYEKGFQNPYYCFRAHNSNEQGFWGVFQETLLFLLGSFWASGLFNVGIFNWAPNSNLANLVICGIFIEQSTFCHINGQHKL